MSLHVFKNKSSSVQDIRFMYHSLDSVMISCSQSCMFNKGSQILRYSQLKVIVFFDLLYYILSYSCIKFTNHWCIYETVQSCVTSPKFGHTFVMHVSVNTVHLSLVGLIQGWMFPRGWYYMSQQNPCHFIPLKHAKRDLRLIKFQLSIDS